MAEQLKYRKRVADSLLSDKLEAVGAVLIEGAKACGKTTTAEQQAKSVLYMNDPDSIAQNLQLADTNSKLLLRGNTPRLIDEWQIAPQLLDAIRFEVDHRGDDGQFILTGSAVPADTSKIALVYQRFNTNLGGKDLVAQWERCIAMSKDKPYIWLFSDDDVMEPNCVEALLRQVDETKTPR